MGPVIGTSYMDAFDDTLLQAPSTNPDPSGLLRIPKRPKPSLEWNDMPTELRLMFLEKIAQITRVHPPPQKGSLPAVCTEWRDFFEKRNFESLTVKDLDDIVNLNLIVNSRREGFVKRIALFVALGAYDCRRCDQAESDGEKEWNNVTFGRTLLLLLEILSTWGLLNKEQSYEGLTLMIGAASVSDVQHNYTKLEGLKCDPAVREAQHLRHYQSHQFSQEGFKKRTLGSLLDFDTGFGEMIFEGPTNDKDRVKIPQVRTVRRLLLDRRYFRSLSAQALELVLRRLPCLTEIKYVYWCGIDREEQSLRDLANLALLKAFPSTVTGILLQEIYDIELHEHSRKVNDETVAAAAVEATRRLSYFHGSNALDAAHFFKDFYPGLPHQLVSPEPWTTLRYLALTSRSTMRHDVSPLLANQLLVAAANAALHMPKLKIMELWISWKVHGTFVFHYAVLDNATVLETGAAWPFDLQQEARDAWERVAFANTRHRLRERIIDSADLTAWNNLSKTIRMLRTLYCTAIARYDVSVHPTGHLANKQTGNVSNVLEKPKAIMD
ncbi:f-box domain-containing protein [Colletotrichum incanum]|uniref:F-box domain-containing protein n=1 Tax=Colletotrichum incanum TaxID=1573173 RepID=A0A166L4F6_COLIC|nr:f-box domain-containing protein [Colletotrichum incanum]